MGASTRIRIALLAAAIVAGGCGGGGGGAGDTGGPSGPTGPGGTDGPTTPGGTAYGAVHQGVFWRGVVDFAETEWHNACAPEGKYTPSLREATGLGGEYVVGISNQVAGHASLCDACVAVKAGNGKAVVARIITYGDTSKFGSQTDWSGNMDVSLSVLAALGGEGYYPPYMTWQLTDCPPTGNLVYEFKSASSVWWFGFWVRNPRAPISRVEISTDQQSWAVLPRDGGDSGDGSLVYYDNSNPIPLPFWLRVTGMNGKTVTEKFTSVPTALKASSQQL